MHLFIPGALWGGLVLLSWRCRPWAIADATAVESTDGGVRAVAVCPTSTAAHRPLPGSTCIADVTACLSWLCASNLRRRFLPLKRVLPFRRQKARPKFRTIHHSTMPYFFLLILITGRELDCVRLTSRVIAFKDSTSGSCFFMSITSCLNSQTVDWNNCVNY